MRTAHRFRYLLPLSVLLAGCHYTNRLAPVPGPRVPHTELAIGHHLERHDVLQYLSCDFESGLPDANRPELVRIPKDSTSSVLSLAEGHLDAARQVWPYALMTSNAYNDPATHFRIPGWRWVGHWSSPSGLSLERWEREGTPAEIVVAFRGTDSREDWRTNLALFHEPAQYREAYAYMQVLMGSVPPGTRVVTTGHSLGGALAFNMAQRFPRIEVAAFDASPRAYFGRNRRRDVQGHLVYERGEILAPLRRLWVIPMRRYGRRTTRLWYDFIDFRFFRSLAAVEEHSAYLLARGLMLAAIKAGDPVAARAFTANFQHLGEPDLRAAFRAETAPDGGAHDIRYCQRIFQGEIVAPPALVP